MNQQKRVLAVHDISGVGRCSLTVALPIISAAGVECSVLPTAILSTHTGGFTGYTCRDLSDDILPMVAHWQTLGLHFDAIYTGYLAGGGQVELIIETLRRLASGDTLRLIDPVMGDNGALYAGFDEKFPPQMLQLCRQATLITPNLTEAALLLGEPWRPGPYRREYIEDLLRRLARLTGVAQIVLTGVYFDDRQLGAAVCDGSSGGIDYVLDEKIPGMYHGTGDVFGSALAGALVAGKPLRAAARIAVEFTLAGIRWSAAAGTEIRYGVNFETNLPQYIAAIRSED